MKCVIYIFILFTVIVTHVFAQDSTFANAKFNFYEFNINSSNYIKQSYNKPLSFNSANIGVKMGRNKVSFGVLACPVYVLYYLAGIQYPLNTINSEELSLNIYSNYQFYIFKTKKNINPYLSINFNTQKIKDYVTSNTFEYKHGYSFGIGLGTTFLVKSHFIIEPCLHINPMWFRDKNIYKITTPLTTTYTEEIGTAGELYTGIGLKLGYIIPFKNK